MFRHTVVAVHFETTYEPLLDSLTEIYRLGGREFTLVDVLRIDAAEHQTEEYRDEARRRLEQKQADLRAAGFSVRYELPVGFPAPELVKIAHGYRADLLLIASRGEGLWREFYHGSTVLEIARLTRTPTFIERIDPKLAAAHGELAVAPMLATDFSERGIAAEGLALELGQHAGRLTVFHAMAHESERDAAQRSIEELAARARARGIEVATRLETGQPTRAIGRLAEAEGSSAVIVGKRGAGPARELQIGATAQGVCRYCPCSVLIVPGSESTRRTA